MTFGLIFERWYSSGREHFGIIVVPQLIPSVVALRVMKLVELYPKGIKNLYLFA